MYLEAAEESAGFIRDHLYNANNVVQDGISASCQGSAGNVTVLESHNSGLMIEGLAILYSLTHNDSIHELWVLILVTLFDAESTDRVGDIVTAAMENTEWQTPSGILSSGGTSHDLVSNGWILTSNVTQLTKKETCFFPAVLQRYTPAMQPPRLYRSLSKIISVFRSSS